jgi:1,4-dihydroxy-2-naphthoate octaprenyltransferase
MNLVHAIILLRIPFSFFLLPVFLFAVALMDQPHPDKLFILFLLLHILVYPASNAFNSYMDQDEGSIGGLKNPPKAGPLVLWLSIIFNLAAIFCSYFFLGLLEAYAITAYIITSILYSWKAVRLKRYALPSFLTVVFFQGAFIYALVYLAGQKVSYAEAIKQVNFLYPSIISSLLIAGIYPMTQIYQHEEDAKNGDHTLSRFLGIRGTFEFCSFMFAVATGFMGYHFINSDQSHYFYIFLLFNFPSLAFFAWWASKVWQDPKQANFRYTMMLNKTSSIAMVLYFILIYFIKHSNELPF